MPVDAVPALPAGKLRSVVTYLEMTAPPWGDGSPPSPASPHPGITVDRLATVPIALYRDLYRRVGEPWLWWERLVVADDALAITLNDPAVEVRVFRNDAGDVIGYSELDRRHADDVEIVFFGLVPDAIGRGLGRTLFAATLAAAWQSRPSGSMPTDDVHPSAESNHQSNGLGDRPIARSKPKRAIRSPRRVWLHTCSEDHPKALAFYRAAGFRPYRTETVIIDDPRAVGLLPDDAGPHVPQQTTDGRTA